MEGITLEAFVNILLSYGETSCSSAEQLYQIGLLEEIDLMKIAQPIQRDTAARILHLYLKKIRKEADSTNWKNAEQLYDLYDCRTCVQHIAEVVEKGIMEPETEGEKILFFAKRILTRNEAVECCERAFYPARRLKRTVAFSQEQSQQLYELTQSEAIRCLKEENGAGRRCLADVRPAYCYEEFHLPGAISCPLAEILDGSFDRVFARWEEIFFYCDQGYQAKLAAAFLTEKQLAKAFYFCLSDTNESVSER